MSTILSSLQQQLKIRLRGKRRVILFLDFDGTLAPIVRRPEKAAMPKATREALSRLTRNKFWKIGVVSGRDLKTLQRKIRMPRLFLAGNHGFELMMPGEKPFLHPSAKRSRPLIQSLCRLLAGRVRSIPGALVENKGVTATLHTRMCRPAAEKKAVTEFHSIVGPWIRKRKIRMTKGKKVLEMRPPADWHKGKAVEFLLGKLGGGFPIYIGDDATDEDAFKALRRKGFCLCVGPRRSPGAHRNIPSIRHLNALLGAFRTALG